MQDIGYRARDPRNLNRVIAEIKELKKKVAARAKESEEKQTLVDQAELSIGRNGAFAKLRDVTVKPVRRKRRTQKLVLEMGWQIFVVGVPDICGGTADMF